MRIALEEGELESIDNAVDQEGSEFGIAVVFDTADVNDIVRKGRVSSDVVVDFK